MFIVCRVNGLPARRRAFGLFSWIQLDYNWTDMTANFFCQLQSNWIQLNRPKMRLLTARPITLHTPNIVRCGQLTWTVWYVIVIELILNFYDSLCVEYFIPVLNLILYQILRYNLINAKFVCNIWLLKFLYSHYKNQ